MTRELSLFTYGSLSEGQVHYNKISPYIVEKEEAYVLGAVYRLPSGHPVFLQTNPEGNEPADRIFGHRVTLQAPDVAHLLLDEFQGFSHFAPEKSLFLKVQMVCENLYLEKKECYIYAMNPSKLPKAALRIEGGDWRRNLAELPLLTQSLSEKQATYIKKLSQSSGRDIVPIDIGLYRELMKLELIVDKGRRLALSKLGAEVARYLPEA